MTSVLVADDSALVPKNGFTWPNVESISSEKIRAGKADVPTDAMRRLRAFIISVDPKTRVARVRLKDTDQIVDAVMLPHSEFYHHAAPGMIDQFEPGGHVVVRFHQDRQGEWRLATYLKDDLWQYYGHKQYLRVDRIDAITEKIDYTQEDNKGNTQAGAFFVDAKTRYWKNSKPATLEDVDVGDRLRIRTHGRESGPDRVAWDVICDDESLDALFRIPQLKRLDHYFKTEGHLGYVDNKTDNQITVSLFRFSADAIKNLRDGDRVRIAPADWSQQAIQTPIEASFIETLGKGKNQAHVFATQANTEGFIPTHTARIWFMDTDEN